MSMSDDELTEIIDKQLEELAQLQSERDHAILQAQIHAQEARTQQATVAEIYRLCSGGKGEPGDWHGAEPVRRALADAEQREQALAAHVERLTELITDCLESDPATAPPWDRAAR
ncbi:MAG TPA: hypothetical protein VFM75_10855, partial [Modicisalibacter sp.]|nr:hypothetical protein [Modicisalibacter sp.]